MYVHLLVCYLITLWPYSLSQKHTALNKYITLFVVHAVVLNTVGFLFGFCRRRECLPFCINPYPTNVENRVSS